MKREALLSDLASNTQMNQIHALVFSLVLKKTSEFYQVFWPILKKDFLAVLTLSLDSGSLPHSFRRAIITLLPKKGDLADILNWRPVSLLHTDYKIFAKLLAGRLKQCIGCVVDKDQSYCVPGRSIYDNINLIRDVIF